MIWTAIITSSALSAIISGIFNSINNRRKTNKALQLLLLGEITHQGKEFITDGKIAQEELQAFSEIYETYKSLGGNGYAEAMMTKMKSLPMEIE